MTGGFCGVFTVWLDCCWWVLLFCGGLCSIDSWFGLFRRLGFWVWWVGWVVCVLLLVGVFTRGFGWWHVFL